MLATSDVSKVAEASAILTVSGAGFPIYTKLEVGREGGQKSYSTQVSLTAFKGIFQISAQDINQTLPVLFYYLIQHGFQHLQNQNLSVLE